MKVIHSNRRLLALAVAIALLGGIAAWRLSGTAQADRSRSAAGSVPAKTGGRPGLDRAPESTNGPFRIEPGGPMLGAACVVSRAGIDGSRVRLVPLDASRPLLRGCAERLTCPRTLRDLCSRIVAGVPCVELGSASAHALEGVGGGYREALPAQPLRPLARCGARTLPPGYAVPLGR
jgi:hypothetical protein